MHRIPGDEILIHPDYLAARSLKMDRVPQMLVVTSDGLVTGSWLGAHPWTEEQIIEAGARKQR